MILKADIHSYDFIEIKETIHLSTPAVNESYWFPAEEKKWIEHCKKHGFNRWDTHGKIYQQYLILCAEGLI